MLTVTDLHAYYGRAHILQGVSFTLPMPFTVPPSTTPSTIAGPSPSSTDRSAAPKPSGVSARRAACPVNTVRSPSQISSARQAGRFAPRA